MITKVLQIALREYLETVKTKSFIIGILIMPVMTIGLIFFMGKFQEKVFSGPRDDINVAVLIHDMELAGPLPESFESYNTDNPGRKLIPHILEMSEEEAKQALLDEDFSVLLVVDSATVNGDGHARLFSPPGTDMTLQSSLRRIINNAVTSIRYEQNGFSPELIRELSRGVWLEDFRLSDKGEGKANRAASTMMPFFFMFLMFIAIITTSSGLLNSVIEEKNSRVIEVLLSAIGPVDMMAGKIIGQSAIGLTFVLTYVIGGVAALMVTGYADVLNTLGGMEIAVFAIYFVLGFLLFNSLFAAVGSAFNSLKEAQTIISPLMIVLTLPMILWMVIVQQPDGLLAVALSIIPPVSPMVMIMRVTVMPSVPWLDVAASLVVLAAATCGAVWAAARVFRVGILMYGKPPSIKEILRWVRQN